METVSKFGERLLKLREERNETQQQLADAIGITRQSLSRYETNDRTPNIDLVYNIAKHYNVSADYLLGLSEIQSSNKKIETACEVTGLSEEAVKKLQIFHENENMYTPSRINCVSSESIPGTGFFVFDAPSAIKITSELIEHRFFEILIGDIQTYSVMNGERNNTVNISEELYNNIKNNPISSTYNYYITPNIIAETKLNHASDCIKRMITEIAKSKEASNNAEHNPKKE